MCAGGDMGDLLGYTVPRYSGVIRDAIGDKNNKQSVRIPNRVKVTLASETTCLSLFVTC